MFIIINDNIVNEADPKEIIMFPSFYLAFHDPIHLLQPPNGIPHVSLKSLSIVRFIATF